MTLKTFEQQVADELIASFMHTPEMWKWRNADLDIVCGPRGISMSANYMTIYGPVAFRFGFWNRRRIRRAFRRWEAEAGKAGAEHERHRALLAIHQCLSEPLKAAA